ncbi:unnamed protein product [Urochloa humidicola]
MQWCEAISQQDEQLWRGGYGTEHGCSNQHLERGRRCRARATAAASLKPPPSNAIDGSCLRGLFFYSSFGSLFC